MKEAVFSRGEYWPASRLHPLGVPGTALSLRELLVLFATGVLAALAVALVAIPLRIPGHAIVKAALPMVIGVALVPRQGAGSISAVSAGMTAWLLGLLGIGHVQPAAVTSLLAIGPALDVALYRAPQKGWPLYFRFALAGLLANTIAFAVRWGTAAFALDSARPRMIGQFGWGVWLSFALCGLAAGLLSAIICFRYGSKSE